MLGHTSFSLIILRNKTLVTIPFRSEFVRINPTCQRFPFIFTTSAGKNFRFFTYTLMRLSHWEIRTAPWRNSFRHIADKSEVCWQCWDRRWRKGIWCRTRGYKSSDTSLIAFVGFESDLKISSSVFNTVLINPGAGSLIHCTWLGASCEQVRDETERQSLRSFYSTEKFMVLEKVSQ